MLTSDFFKPADDSPVAWEHILKANKPGRNLCSFFSSSSSSFSSFLSRLLILLLHQADAYFSREAVALKKYNKKKILLDAWDNFVLAPIALGDGMTVPIIGVFSISGSL